MILGFHVNRHGRTLAVAVKEDIKKIKEETSIETSIVQIFVHGPQSYKRIADDYEPLSVKTIIHGSYMDHPWSLSQPAIACIVDEFKICDVMDGLGVIIHMSKALADDPVSGAELLDSKLSEVLKTKRTLYLEVNAAKPGPHTFDTSDKINNIVAQVSDAMKSVNVGVCIDTAHLHSLGVSDIIGVIQNVTVRPMIVHLNDSGVQLGGARDVHAPLCLGYIWKKDNSQLKEILKWCVANNIPMILERSFDYVAHDVKIIKELLGV